MPQPSYIALELLINKFSEFIDWIFQKRKKSELDKLIELDSILRKQLDTSIFEISENSFDNLKFKLEKVDAQILNRTISLLFKSSISTDNNEMLQRLKSNEKLRERILEIILFEENRNNVLSLEARNIKNSLQQQLRLRFNNLTDARTAYNSQ